MNLSKAILVLLGGLILITSGYFYSKKALSFRFVDEEYNFAIGKYLTKGEILYDDLITNHQPLAHILSSQVQRLTNPNSTYLVVANHRKALILWAAFWSMILIYFFNTGALIFVVLFELTKIYLLGYIFLSESLVAYPLITLFGLTVFLKRRLKPWELIFWGICFAIVLFSLLPVWPLLPLLFIQLFLKQRPHLKRSLLSLLIGFLAVFLFVLQFTSVFGYLHYLSVNLTYTIPTYQHEFWLLIIIKSFLSPFLSFTPLPQTPTLWIIRVLSFMLILVFLSKHQFKKGLLLLTSLTLINIRFIYPGTEGYAGFHLLPWYAVFVFISSMVAVEEKKFINYFLIFLAVILSVNFARTNLFSKGDNQQEYYINYSTYTSIGEVIRVMKNPQDALFVSPDNWLIYWQSDTNHLPKLFGYYAWMAGVPKLHQQILQNFEKNPPTFFYCENCKSLDLEKYLPKYQELKKEGGSTYLYVLPEKIKDLNFEQKNKLNYYKYNF